MATYIPGSQDYIPQYQPWQPDYNFLGNILQTRQNKYDQNYKQLSETYGTLLNSPMLRTDNIEQRNEFFRMIDSDIKRISGMDLSLQQNTDAANKVFESLYQNKNIVKDMTFTKEYQNQLQTAENYRNCIDQEKCGGKYWDVGVNYLNYKADEFKNASRDEAMNMSPGRFAPMINIQEKAMLYAEKLLGKGAGAFGVQNVTWSKDGRYMITTKNGQNLEIPLQQLLLNQYGQDQAIIDMFNAQTFVNRKSFVKQNAAQFGGDENAAEDAYFSQVDAHMQSAQQRLIDAQNKNTNVKAKKNILENEIKTKGSTGDDDLAFDYENTNVDSAAYDVATKDAQETVNIANSIFEAGDNREMKRQRVDALFSRSLMNKSISDAATSVAAMTGSVEIKEDPYAMKYYDFSLDMSKQQAQYDLADRNALRNHAYDLSKQQALEEYKKRGSAVTTSNAGKFVPGYGFTASGETVELAEAQTEIAQYTNSTEQSAADYYNGYGNTLSSIINDPKAGADDKTMAAYALANIFGRARTGQDGKLSNGYDRATNKFYDDKGEAYQTIAEFTQATKDKGTDYFEKAKVTANNNKNIPSQQSFIKSNAANAALESNDLSQKMLDVSSTVWKENNNNIRNFALSKMDEFFDGRKESDYWGVYFKPDGSLRTEKDFTQAYVKSKAPTFKEAVYKVIGKEGYMHEVQKGYSAEDATKEARDLYEKYNTTYAKVYNGGYKVNEVPVVKALHGTNDFNYQVSGKSSGGAVQYTSSTAEPASFANQGLISFYEDALSNGAIVQGLHTDVAAVGRAGSPGTVGKDANAEAAMREWISDVKSGKLTKEEKAEAGKMYYMNTAASNANWEGLQFFPPESWLKKKRGTDTEVTWADSYDATKGITMYTDKRGAKNSFHEAFEAKPYDWMLNHSDVNLDIPNAGKVVIRKRSADGKFYVEGSVIPLDAAGKELPPVSVSNVYDAQTGGQNLYNGIKVWMDEIAAVNSAYKNHQPVQRITDPKHLPNIKKYLDQAAGDAAPEVDPSAAFLQNVQFNLQNMQQVQQQF